ncbi:propionyl-CoA synthetase [Plasticicumulans lactativorans]|uniref:Propionate--CoA ligase n=1 Tax=Plasticicumulans lactativorans TaxID=1133106 RepID=A0A4R2LE99_9GAMM|nr:propionate--CoA ligase [Plasticicumulans lactativorans]TCO81201.1 propionyl-CoA synthetase [Plasticicumulans lactativorans]
MTYESFHRRSIDDAEGFWAEQAELIHWHQRPQQILDYSRPPLRKWFVGGETNLCYNAVDRHLATRADQPALVYLSTETGETRSYSFAELHREVNRAAAILAALGVGKGDRVVIYMPMIAEAIVAMLACARLGAVHSVVFGGFAAHNLAVRIDDAQPKLLITADAGMRNGKPVPYKHLVDEACRVAKHPPAHVLIVDRGLDQAMPRTPGRDLDYAALRAQHLDAEVPVTWVESNAPSYILYTSGTTGTPKGVQRDTGGYCVALAASMKYVYDARPGETMFTTSDIGWVVGHSYIVYGPLIHGMTTICYEGLPTRPDAGIWWKIVEEYKVTTMFSSPTAVRVLKKQDPEYLRQYDLSSLRYLFLAGEPLDEPTSRWISDALGVPVVDHYWQTETGWAMLTYLPGVELKPNRFGSPGFPNYGFNIRVINEATGADAAPNEKGVLVVVPPLPPGCLSTVWGNDDRFVKSYFSQFKELLYTSSDWAVRDDDGYFFILGRTDDVINVAGHRLGTREIEEAVQAHAAVAEVAVVGIADPLKGQEAVVFATLKDPNLVAEEAGRARLEKEVLAKVVELLGPVARPKHAYFVNALPKTRSGKLLRRSIQALAEGRDPGDLSTLDDPNSLEEVRRAVGSTGH